MGVSCRVTQIVFINQTRCTARVITSSVGGGNTNRNTGCCAGHLVSFFERTLIYRIVSYLIVHFPIQCVRFSVAARTWRKSNHGRDGGTSLLRIWSRGANANCPQILTFFKILSTGLLALQCSKKAYQPINSDMIFTTSRKYILNVHQIATLGGQCDIFLVRARTKRPLRIHQNCKTPIYVKIIFSRERNKERMSIYI